MNTRHATVKLKHHNAVPRCQPPGQATTGNGSVTATLTGAPPKAVLDGVQRPPLAPNANDLVTVLIAEAVPLLRRGLEAALSDDPRVAIVATLEDPRSAVEAAMQLRPRVVVMGSQLQHIDGIQSIRRIRTALPEVAIIAIGTSEEDAVIFSAIEAGAIGYVLQDISAEALREAIHSVCNGMTMVHPRIVRKMVDRLTLLSEKVGSGGAAGLTGRELEVLLSMAAGRTDKEIAREFSITEATVKSHIRTVFQKTGAANRVQAVALAMRVGLIR